MFLAKKSKLAFVNLFLIILFLLFDIQQKKTPDEFIVYQTGKYDYLSFIHEPYELAITDGDVMEYPDLVDYQTHEHRIHKHASERILQDICDNKQAQIPYLVKFQNFIGFHEKRFAIIDADIVVQEFEDSIQVDYLIISGNPTLDIDKLLKTYHCKKVIFASSNSSWNTSKWSEEFQAKGLSVYDVKKENAFILTFE